VIFERALIYYKFSCPVLRTIYSMLPIVEFVELYFKNIILGFLPIVYVFCVMLFDIILLDSECYPLFSYDFSFSFSFCFFGIVV